MSDEALTERYHIVQDTIAQHYHLTTEALHRQDGRWSDERAAIHRKIVDEFYDRYKHIPNDRRGLMAGGLGGAGKTTTLRSGSDYNPDDYMPLNPDDFKDEIASRDLAPEVPGHNLSPMERSALFHQESSYLAEMLAERAYADGRNVVWDATMADPGAPTRRVGDMRRHGYSVDGVFVHVPVETSISRIRARYREAQREWMQGRGPGGRPVPEYLVMSSRLPNGRSTNLETFEQMQSHFDRWSLYDNTGSAPRLVSRS
jgi:predicted ABC-type ATPase